MNSIDQRYKVLLQKILDEGVRKQTRNGEVLSIFSHQIRHNMVEGFPLLTTKKMYWKGIVTELCWFLKGRTDLKYLLDNDCYIWVGDAYQAYLQKETARTEKTGQTWTPLSKEEFIDKIKTDDEFARKFGDLGKIYGKQWRSWGIDKVDFNTGKLIYIDQIANLISELKTNPDSRRLLVSAWNVGELDQMTLPPCHYGFQVYTRELSMEERQHLYEEKYMFTAETIEEKEFDGKYNVPTRAISLMWSQRSVDTPLGLPYNIASYALLLEIIAKEVNMIPEELIGNLGDCHIYTNQIEGVKQQLEREPYKLPTLKKLPSYLCGPKGNWECYKPGDFQLENYQSHPKISMPLSN